jgi:CDP-glucose 4,6-dehydratase
MRNFTNTFKGKEVLVTGHTGFKGSWLIAWLKLLGANVHGISNLIPTFPSHYDAANLNEGIIDHRIDIRNYADVEKTIKKINPDFVFHLAAQALVKKSYTNPIETWETNLNGTLNVLESLRNIKKKCIAVIITSDKCYDNVEWIWGYRENDALGGPDPYSASKGAAELVIKSYIKSFFPKSQNIRVVSARAGNVIGGGDWALDRIVPDCVKAWSMNQILELRNPHATRPWQHVLEPLSGYISLAANLNEHTDLHGHAFNFGPKSNQNKSVLELVNNMAIYWNQVRIKDVSNLIEGPYESGLLKLNCDKALAMLKWEAVLDFNSTVKLTAEWYKYYYENPKDISKITYFQIKEYCKIAKEKDLEWAK